MKLNSVVRRLYLMEFISQSVAVFTLYSIMFSERGGLSAFQVGALLATFAITTIVAEIPSGAIADRYSRKWSLVFSKLILAAAMLVWLLSPNFVGYFVGVMLMGISDSLSSGALQAYLYEHLGEDKREFGRYNSRLWAMMMGGFIVGSAIASIVGPNYEALLVLSIISPLLGAFIATTLAPDGDGDVLGEQKESLIKNSGSAFRYIFSHRKLLYAVAAIVLIKLLVDVMIEYIPLYYRDVGASVRTIPILFLVGNIITIFLFWHTHTIGKFLEKREVAAGLGFLICLGLTAYAGTALAVLGIFWYVRFVRIMFIYKEGEIQHLLQNHHRATATSIYSMFARLLTGISFLLIGLAASRMGSVVTPMVIFAVVTYTLYMVVKFRSRLI